MNLSILASHHLAGLILNVQKSTIKLFAHVCRLTLVDHLIVVLNVQLTLTVPQIWLVSE
jgi:hypothetical protein